MRDQHRPKQDLINEVSALRKQVTDLKEAMTARRRVEDALRAAEERAHMLADNAPVGLCLFRSDGTPILANRPFARLLGYDSSAELLRVAGTLGVFASADEQARVFALVEGGQEWISLAIFRQKDGTRQAFGVLGAVAEGRDSIILVTLMRRPEPWGAPSLASLGAARPAHDN